MENSKRFNAFIRFAPSFGDIRLAGTICLMTFVLLLILLFFLLDRVGLLKILTKGMP